MKRRTFLKTVGGAAGAAALSSCSHPSAKQPVPTAGNAAKAESPGVVVKSHGTIKSKGKRKQHLTYSVGEELADSSPFNIHRRMPGWLPDAADITGDGSQNILFPEEVYKYSLEKGFPFQLPDPVDPDPSWILGGPIPDQPDQPQQKPFICLIRDFARAIRLYNVALYDLRRYHFKKVGLDLPFNKHGNPQDRGDLPDPGNSSFGTRAQIAEGNWVSAAQALNGLIDPPVGQQPPYNLALVAVDMVQVNNYIVSMRLVTRPSGINPLQVGGSDSSHVSISSVFSSPSQ